MNYNVSIRPYVDTDAFYMTRLDKVERLGLFDDWAEKLDLTSPKWRSPMLFNLQDIVSDCEAGGTLGSYM